MTTEPTQPSNVIAALARVMAEMPAVGKDAQYSGGGSGSYSYRSIEAVTAAAQKLLGKYGAVPVPRVVSRKTLEITVNGKPWTQEELEIVYRFYGPGGLEDHVDVGPVWGLGRDNSDKGSNKAMTQAYKVALIQVLCIGDSGHDGDAERAETDAQAPVDPGAWFKENGWADRAHHDDVRRVFAERVTVASESVRSAFGKWFRDQDAEWAAAWPHAFYEEVVKRFDALSAERPAEPPLLKPEEAEAVGAALVEHLKALDRDALVVQCRERKLSDTGTDDRLRQRLAAALLAEGWRPVPKAEPVPESTCAWCGLGRTETKELEVYGDETLHPGCFDERQAQREADDPGRIF